jgi:cobyrinic acid a,c-diamide synthase
VRAGYVVGAADLVAELARSQPPWSVSTTAAAAMLACSSAEAVAEAGRRAERMTAWRHVLVEALHGLGLRVAADPTTPFVLVHGPAGLRERLREAGFAVRRGDTFPGLGPGWVRIAVRGPEVTAALATALARLAVTA